MNFETLQLDSPEIPEDCREAYRQRIGTWPAPGQMDDRAAVWAMAWLSKPDAPAPLTEAQQERLYENLPASAQQDARSKAAFKRLAMLFTRVYRIGEEPRNV